ncbi:MAG TPA: hypothetical protein VEW11_04610, partial [Gaiellaceae bacterium]|nr:hypothetical protein [Gaiellaceae bacterium]
MKPGNCIQFPSGEAGAHQVMNRAEDEARVLLISNFSMPRGAVQVDSRKMMRSRNEFRFQRSWKRDQHRPRLDLPRVMRSRDIPERWPGESGFGRLFAFPV